MGEGEAGRAPRRGVGAEPKLAARPSGTPLDTGRRRASAGEDPTGSSSVQPPDQILETSFSPFHCLYQDALHFHNESRLSLARSESEASRQARAGLVLYLAAAEALVHQAAAELGRPELSALVSDPSRPLPLADAWRLLPAIVGEGPTGSFDPNTPPWPQFSELLALRTAWAYPGLPGERRAFYRSTERGEFEPLQPHEAQPALGIPAERLCHPRTGLPRDPYAIRPRHLDTARSVLDAAIEALDRRLAGALTREQRHRRELVRVLPPPSA